MKLFSVTRKSLLVLVVGASLLCASGAWSATKTWDNGTASGVWDVSTTANWTADDFDNGDDAVFTGTPSGTITIAGGGVLPASTSVGGSNNYTFTGGSIGGAGALNKSGAGILQLSSANAFSGGINFGGGTIKFTATNQLGSSAAAFTATADSKLSFNNAAPSGPNVANPLTINPGVTFTLDRELTSHFATYSGKISGNGTLRVESNQGNYWRFTNATNDYSQLVVAGLAWFDNDGAMGLDTSIQVDSGAVITSATNAGAGKTLAIGVGTPTITTGTTSGTWVGLVTGGGIRVTHGGFDNAANTMASISVTGVSTNGSLRVGVAGSLGSGAITYDSNFGNTLQFFNSTGGTFTNTLNFSAATTATRTIDVTQAGAVINWTGSISAGGAITKIGTGTFATTNWNATNTLAVNAGKFLLNDSTTSNINDITVGTNGTFGGNGTVTFAATKSLTVNGTLEPGNNGAGTLTLNGPLTLNSSALLKFELGPTGIVGGGVNDLVVLTGANGNLTLDGTLQIADLGGFGGGTYRLFNYSGTLTDNGLILLNAGEGFLSFSTPGQVNLVFPAPEPATAWMIGLPLLIVGRRIRRNRR